MQTEPLNSPCTMIVTLLSTLLGGLDTKQVTRVLLVAADASTDSILLRPLRLMTASYGYILSIANKLFTFQNFSPQLASQMYDSLSPAYPVTCCGCV